jgi:uncharacterized membrane protein YdjX (TVP38/TMEM64 family)
MEQYLLVAAIVFAVNLLPAFGPPTWTVLVVLQINLGLEPAVLVAIGACSATGGRWVLALLARRFRGRMSAGRLENLDAVSAELTANRTRGAAALGLFLVSPLPSAQLFIAAGLLDAPLRPLLAAFLLGRLVAYSLYVSLATAAAAGVGEVLVDALRSPIGIAIQLLMLAGLAALLRIDWATRLGRRASPGHP